MRTATLWLLLVVCAAGCFLGDPSAYRSVSLQFPALSQARAASVTYDNEAQEVLRLLDTIMASHGLTRETNAPPANESHMIAAYNVWAATGQKLAFAGPTVRFQSNKMDIAFMEFPARHSSPRVKQLCDEIADKLSTRYGSKAVKIEH